MAWVNAPAHAYIDYWDPDQGNRRWYRKLDLDRAAYLYRYDQTDPDQFTGWATPHAAPIPTALGSGEFLISDRTDRQLYETTLTLTADLAGVLIDIGLHVAEVQERASQLAEAADAAVATASERIERIATERRADTRDRLVRQGLCSMLDAANLVVSWSTLTPALTAPYRNRLIATAARTTAIATQLHAASKPPG